LCLVGEAIRVGGGEAGHRAQSGRYVATEVWIVPNWRDELIEAVKTKAERDAEERERHRKRVEEALTTAEAAMTLGVEGLRFAREKLLEKEQPVELTEQGDSYRLTLRDVSLSMELSRESALIKVTFGDGKPREFDFAKDRHIAPADVEEYIGRRALEFVRAAQKGSPW
jgi:hypothetical protein